MEKKENSWPEEVREREGEGVERGRGRGKEKEKRGDSCGVNNGGGFI